MNLTPEQVDLIKRTICKGATDDELSLFLNQAQRLGLDPLSRQIHAVKRWDAKQQREVMSIQVGIDGFRLIAERTGEMDGAVGPEWCGSDGVWRDIWLDKEPPVAARVTVYRKGRQYGYVGIAHWAEYCQRGKDGKPMAMWARMQTVMIAKCAEAIALRRACPAELSGLYEPAELPEVASESIAAPQQKQLPAPQAVRTTMPTYDAEPAVVTRPAETRRAQGELPHPDELDAVADDPEQFKTALAGSLFKWPGLIKAINREFDAQYTTKTTFDQIDRDHRAWAANVLLTSPNPQAK